MRRSLKLADQPKLVVLTSSGMLDPSIRGLHRGALVLTTESGAEKLRAHVAEESEIVVLGKSKLAALDVVGALTDRGYGVLLCEGGSSIVGMFLAESLLGELFLTLAPTLVGRDDATQDRPGLIEGFAYADALGVGTLLSAKLHGPHLFLRYRLAGGLPPLVS